jgi:hypothetical protein
MRSLIALACVLLVQTATTAQQVIDLSKTDGGGALMLRSVGGEPVLGAKVVRTVEGSPFFRDEWLNTAMLLPSGVQYTNVSARLNLMANQVYYLDTRKNEFIAQALIRELAITDAMGKRYRFLHSRYIDATGLKEGWYQQLSDGTATLYKYYDKIVSSQKPYGSATEEQTIHTKEKYLVVQDGKFYELKKLKDVPNLFPAKKDALQSFVGSKELEGLSTEDKYIALVRYYNSILP